ncbi:hypothetical protein Tco_0149708 [Tanacetum coccineum]
MLAQACPLKGKARTSGTGDVDSTESAYAKQRGLKASRWWQDGGLMLILNKVLLLPSLTSKGKGVKLNASLAHSERISALAEVEKDQKAFIRGSWSDSENDAKDKTNDETCLMDQSLNEVTLNFSCYSDNASFLDNDNMQIEYDSLCEIRYALEELAWNRMREWIKDSGLLNIYPVKGLFSTYKAYGGGSSIVAIRTDHGQEFDNEVQFRAYCDAQGYSQNSKAYVVLNKHTMKVKELLNVTFDESPTPTNVSPLVDDDVGEEEAIKKNTKVVNNNDEEEDESIEVDETVNIRNPRIIH